MKNKKLWKQIAILTVSFVLVSAIGMGLGIKIAKKMNKKNIQKKAMEVIEQGVKDGKVIDSNNMSVQDIIKSIEHIQDMDEVLDKVTELSKGDIEKEYEVLSTMTDGIKVTDVTISDIYAGYVDIEITVKNDSDFTLNYIEVDIFLKDKNGNTLSSEWTNKSGTTYPNDQQILTKMIKIGEWTSIESNVKFWN